MHHAVWQTRCNSNKCFNKTVKLTISANDPLQHFFFLTLLFLFGTDLEKYLGVRDTDVVGRGNDVLDAASKL